MVVSITPDYDLFIRIIFVIWVIKGVLQFIVGMARTEKYISEKYNGLDALAGAVTLIIIIWCCW